MRTFIKCDFHIHSSSDFSRTYSESDFLDALESSGLDCVAITDHNGIDLDLYKRAKARLDSKGIGLLAGVELNLKLSQTTIDDYGLSLQQSRQRATSMRLPLLLLMILSSFQIRWINYSLMLEYSLRAM